MSGTEELLRRANETPAPASSSISYRAERSKAAKSLSPAAFTRSFSSSSGVPLTEGRPLCCSGWAGEYDRSHLEQAAARDEPAQSQRAQRAHPARGRRGTPHRLRPGLKCAPQEDHQAAPAARHLQLLFLGLRRQLLGDPDQPGGRLQLALRAGRPGGQGPSRPQLQAARREQLICWLAGRQCLQFLFSDLDPQHRPYILDLIGDRRLGRTGEQQSDSDVVECHDQRA